MKKNSGRRLKIALLNVPRHFVGSRYGLGYQVPLGLVSIGGPLVDAGHEVALIDADVRSLSPADIIDERGLPDKGSRGREIFPESIEKHETRWAR